MARRTSRRNERLHILNFCTDLLKLALYVIKIFPTLAQVITLWYCKKFPPIGRWQTRGGSSMILKSIYIVWFKSIQQKLVGRWRHKTTSSKMTNTLIHLLLLVALMIICIYMSVSDAGMFGSNLTIVPILKNNYEFVHRYKFWDCLLQGII